MDMYPTQLHALATGHGLLALCAALYLAWWFEFFRPRDARPQGLEYGVGVALIVGAACIGILAVVRICSALSAMPSLVPTQIICPAAVVVYAVLAFATWKILGRSITTELLLIVAWAALEIAVAGSLLAIDTGQTPARLLLVLTVIGFALSMVCYVKYYHLTGWQAFLDGCAPLVVVGVIGLASALMIG